MQVQCYSAQFAWKQWRVGWLYSGLFPKKKSLNFTDFTKAFPEISYLDHKTSNLVTFLRSFMKLVKVCGY